MKPYLKIIAIFYGIGALLHMLDLFSLRLNFSNMTALWKIWIVFLLVADTFVALMLWKEKVAGEYIFLLIASIQLVMYGLFVNYFGNQTALIVFHAVTMGIYLILKYRLWKKLSAIGQ